MDLFLNLSVLYAATAYFFYCLGRKAGIQAGVQTMVDLWAEKYRMTRNQAAHELEYRLYEGTRAGAIREIADLRAKK